MIYFESKLSTILVFIAGLFCFIAPTGQAKTSSFLQNKTLLAKKDSAKTTVDFEGQSISGARRLPLSSVIDGAKKEEQTMQTGFVQIRLHWRDKIKASTSSLNSISRKAKKKK